MKFNFPPFNRIKHALDVLWGTPSNGQVFTYDSALEKAKWANGGSGDMTKATYDANNDGIVDNAAALGGDSAATIASSIAAKLPLSGGTVSGPFAVQNSESINATVEQTTAGSTARLRLTAKETAPSTAITASIQAFVKDSSGADVGVLGRLDFQRDATNGGRVVLVSTDTSGIIQNIFSTQYGGLTVTFAGLVTSSTGIDATALTGLVPTVSRNLAPTIACAIRDLMLVTSNPVAWKATGFDIDTGAPRVLASECLTSGEATLQTFTLRTSFLRVPDGFTAFKTNGAFTFSLVADDTSSANATVTGYTLFGYTDRESTATTLLAASGLTLAASSASIPKVTSVNRSAFASTTVPLWIVAEFDLSVRSGKAITIADFCIASE